MKVLKEFFCIQSKQPYKVGDDYKGNRKDLKGFVEYKQVKKVKPKK